MQQTVTAKLQILVNPSDKQIFCDTMKAYSDACNYVSEYIYKTHNLSRYSVQEDTYHQIREIYGLRSQMAVSCVRTVIAKYKTILENQNDWIKPVNCGCRKQQKFIPQIMAHYMNQFMTKNHLKG